MVVVITAGFLLMAGLLRLADRRAAQAGDIIAFPATRVPSVSTAPFAARRAIVADSMTCVLDVQTMQKSGGSLVVEASRFDPGRIFRVHWVGVRTSSDRDDCGSSADLLLNSNQISALIFAAGGTGVEAHNRGVFDNAVRNLEAAQEADDGAEATLHVLCRRSVIGTTARTCVKPPATSDLTAA